MKKVAIGLGTLGLGALAVPAGVGALTGGLAGGDHPLAGAALGAVGGTVGGVAGGAAGAGLGAVHGAGKGAIKGVDAGIHVARGNKNPLSPPPEPSLIRATTDAAKNVVGGGVGGAAGAIHGGLLGGARGGMWGGLAGSATGGALGGSIVNSHDDRKTSVSHYLGVEPIGSFNHEDKINPTRTSITKESSMSTPFTDYMQIKTAAPWSYYSPFMVPAAVGAATGAMQAGPDRRMLGATLGGGAGLVGGHFGGVAGKAIGGVENAALAPKLREIASARALEAEKAYNEAVRAARSKPSVEAKDLVKSNLEHYNKMLDMSRSSDPIKGFSDYPAMLGQLGGSAAGGYLGGSVAGIGNDRR